MQGLEPVLESGSAERAGLETCCLGLHLGDLIQSADWRAD